MLAVTHLDRRGTVLIRFLVGDTVSLTREPCPHCGRTSERVVGPVVRGGDLVKVKGMLINAGALVAALAAMQGAGRVPDCRAARERGRSLFDG